MNHGFVFRAHPIQVRPKLLLELLNFSPDSLLDVLRAAIQCSFKVGVLRLHLLTIVRIHQSDAVLERCLQIGDTPQKMNFVIR